MEASQTVAGERKAIIATYPGVTDVTITPTTEDTTHAAKADAEAYKKGMEELAAEPAKVDHVEPEIADDEHESEEVKRNPKLKERFSELTAKRKEAEKAAKEAADARESERVARQQAEQERDALRAKYEPPKPDILGPEPLPSQFTDAMEYGKALKDWQADATRIEIQKESAAKAAKEQAEILQKNWKDSVDKTIKEIKDFKEVIGASKVMVSAEAHQAILEADNGPKILYHLAQNPDFAEKLSKMTVDAMNREIGKLSAKLDTTAKQTEVKPLADAIQMSKAPAPITPGRGMPTGSASYDTSKMDYQTYKALREAGKIR